MASFSLKGSDFFLLIVLTLSLMRVTTGDLIDETCKKTKYNDLCLWTLRSENRSSSADAEGLAHIVLDVTLKKAKDNLAQINGLLIRTTDPVLKVILGICSEEYGVATVSMLPVAIQKLEWKAYDEARVSAEGAADSAETCEEPFSDGPSVAGAGLNHPSPFTDQNNAVKHLAYVADDIILSFAPKDNNRRPPHATASAIAPPKLLQSFLFYMVMCVMPFSLII